MLTATPAATIPTVFAVARQHPEFRKLWLAQVVSSAGDWLNRMAILALIGTLGGPEIAAGVGALFGVEIALRLLPIAVFGPVAGPLADRLPRRPLMVAADFLRAAIVLAYLFVDQPGDLPLLYGLLLAQMSVGIFFDSARSASLPNTVPKERLHEAYALMSVTWSAMLALGAALGGVLLALTGLTGVFVLDALTYLVSAGFVLRLRLPPTPRQDAPLEWGDILLLRDIRRAVRHLLDRQAFVFVLAKGFWGACGGFLVMLAVAGQERFASVFGSDVGAAGLATSVLYAARGLGTGVGPILARRFSGTDDRDLLRQVFVGFLVGAAGYAVFASMQSFAWAVFAVTIAHFGGSALWVASTVGWQRRIDDRFRGRCYSVEFLLMTVSFTVGALGTGALYDRTSSIELATWAASATVAGGAFVWLGLARYLASRAR